MFHPADKRRIKSPGDHLNIKMSSYQYRDPHVKGKAVSQLFYLKHGNPIPGKDSLYIETWPMSLLVIEQNTAMCPYNMVNCLQYNLNRYTCHKQMT